MTSVSTFERSHHSLGAHGSLLQRKCGCGKTTPSGGKCSECQTAARHAVTADHKSNGVPPIVRQVLGSSGQPLDTGTRAFMEPRFGRSFDGVRIHIGSQAAASADAVNATAYTVGRDIVFGNDHYDPSSVESRELLAHELAHTVQQSSTPVGASSNIVIGGPSDRFEREADRVAGRIVRELPSREPHGLVREREGPRTLRRQAVTGTAAAVKAAELVGLGLSIAQGAQSFTSGGFQYSSDVADRISDQPRAKDGDYEAVALTIGSSRIGGIGALRAAFRVHWEGNSSGEIGAAQVRVDPDFTEFSASTLSVRFTALQSLPRRGESAAARPITWTYEGNFDPFGGGEFDFQGEFEIDAFGGFRSTRHDVIDRSFAIVSGNAEDFVRRGRDRAAAVSAPADVPSAGGTPQN